MPTKLRGTVDTSYNVDMKFDARGLALKGVVIGLAVVNRLFIDVVKNIGPK